MLIQRVEMRVFSEISKKRYYTLSSNRSDNNSTTPAWGTDFLYNHKFKKRGRNFSLSSGIDYSQRRQERNSQNYLSQRRLN